MTAPKPIPETLRFVLGDEVYHRTDPERMGIVIGIQFYPGGYYYMVQWSPEISRNHYDCELSQEKAFTS